VLQLARQKAWTLRPKPIFAGAVDSQKGRGAEVGVWVYDLGNLVFADLTGE
jgi:hypothetical protein